MQTTPVTSLCVSLLRTAIKNGTALFFDHRGVLIRWHCTEQPAELHASKLNNRAARSQNQLGEAQKDLNQAKVNEGKATGEKDAIAKEKEKIAERKDKQRADFKQTLTSLKSNLENATAAPKVLGLSTGQPAATGLEQAKRGIDCLKNYEP
jgi:hypothetical protein